jgi:hypothetical protein
MNFAGKIPTAASLVLPAEDSADMTITLTARGKPDPNAEEVVLQITNEWSLTGRVTEPK